MLKHRKEIHIEWGDCDPFGIVFFPRYFEYFDACTNALFEHALGEPKAAMLRSFGIAGIPLVKASCEFMVPSSYGDVVQVESSVTNWGRSSFDVEHVLYRGQTVAVKGFEKRVWTIREGEKIRGEAIPERLKEKFRV